MTEYKKRQKASIEKSLYGGIKTGIDDFPEIMTIIQVAIYLGVSESTVRKLISDGKLPSISINGNKIQRVHREDLKNYIINLRQTNNTLNIRQ